MSENLLVDGYDYNPHTCMVEVPYNDYWDMQDKCIENKLLKSQLQQKENTIKEVREDLDKQIEFCTNEANGTTNDKYCRIAINYLKHLKDKLDKGE